MTYVLAALLLVVITMQLLHHRRSQRWHDDQQRRIADLCAALQHGGEARAAVLTMVRSRLQERFEEWKKVDGVALVRERLRQRAEKAQAVNGDDTH